MNKKTGVGLGVVAVLVLAASSYASPYWTVYKMRTAIVSKDAAGFSERVDFPALRENIKAQFMTKMADKMNSPEMKSNPFAAFGSALVAGMVNQIVEAMVTPTGVMIMLDSAKLQPPTGGEDRSAAPEAAAPSSSSASPAEQKKPTEYSLSYEGWSTVIAQPKASDADSGAFVFKRDGIWGWKLAGVKLPAM